MLSDPMKRKTRIPHDDAMIRLIRKDPAFAVEYLKAALEDAEDPRVVLIALRHLAGVRGTASQ
jgi:DNA-binding phage protein